ncbi:hypothetical protein BDV93DRAFT_585506 [Ceratobasidium sp. AG-I]|nr:hypothetical protein BDV93DRAFT_585506 [Ceratobasidium sp. AG-I]
MSTYPGFLNSSYVLQPIELPYINNTAHMLGPRLLATACCLLMVGVILCQTLHYFLTFSHDRLPLRALVAVTVTLCTFKACHLIYISWDNFILHFGNYLSGFFIHRTFILSRNWIFLVLTIPTFLLGLVGAFSLTIIVCDPNLHASKAALIIPAADLMVACVVLCDVFITGFTCWYLIRAKTGFAGTDSLISRILMTAIQSAAAPTTCAALNLYFNYQAASNSWFHFFNSLMPFFYVSSMIFTLNARTRISRAGSGGDASEGNAYELRPGIGQPSMGVVDLENAPPETRRIGQTQLDAMSMRNITRSFNVKEDGIRQSKTGSVHKVVLLEDNAADDASFHHKSASAV